MARAAGGPRKWNAAVRRAAAAGLVVVAVTVPALTAAARPPVPDADGGPPVEIPSPPDRPTTTAAPRRLEGLTVTTDSVVAVATVRYNGSPGPISVAWGDGATSTANPADPHETPRPTNHPPGTAVFRHVYTAPADGSAFSTEVVASLLAEQASTVVDITPRYRVEQSVAEFSPTDFDCDTNVEFETEWRITRTAPQHPTKTWEFDRSGRYFEEVPGSAAVFEVTAANAGAIVYHVTELDLIFDEIDQDRQFSLHPALGTRLETLHYQGFVCTADLRATITVTLVVPPAADDGPVARS